MAKKRRIKAELTVAAQMLEKLRAGQDVRKRRTRRLRGAVRAGRYETPMKLQIAMMKMIENT